MVMRTDRLWTGGNVLKPAFASLHANLSGAVAAWVSLISRNRHEASISGVLEAWSSPPKITA
jgi:hypothetical protein